MYNLFVYKINEFESEMGRRSPKLEGKSDAIVALLKYVKMQSHKTLLELELEFSPRNDSENPNGNHGGTEWWRWTNRGNQPNIKLVATLYNHACEKLVKGEWRETGNEALWSPLLPAILDSKLSFLADEKKRLTLLEILKQIESPLVTDKIMRGIALGYYVPSADYLQKIFWSQASVNVDADKDEVSWHRIWSDNEAQREEMEYLVTDIFMAVGLSEENQVVQEKFSENWGFTRKELEPMADYIHSQILKDAQSLSEIRHRMYDIYPFEFKLQDITDDESTKIMTQTYLKLQEVIAIADNNFRIYSDNINLTSKASIMFGLFNRLTRPQFPFETHNKLVSPNLEIF